MKDTRVLSLYLAFSSIAAALIFLIVATAPSPPPPISFLEKLSIAGLFILCCILGISLTFRPNWIRRYFHRSENQEKRIQTPVKPVFLGHHPQCGAFQNHIIQVKKKSWCAGCFGLLIGLCVAIFFMILFTGIELQLTIMTSSLLILLGFAVIFIVYIEIVYRSRNALAHVVVNSLLPLSFAMITIAVGAITGNFAYGFFTILLCVLWLDTRIHLSKWRHRLLCEQCPETCKMFPDSV